MIQLRLARMADLQALYELDQVCFRSGIAYSSEELAALLGHRTCFTVIAEESGGVLAGFAIGQYPDRVGHRPASIVSIDVADAFRRRGVGRELMQAVEARLRERGSPSIHLEVAVDNLPAIAFYQAQGYRKLRRIRDYYMGSLDVWSMEKKLENT